MKTEDNFKARKELIRIEIVVYYNIKKIRSICQCTVERLNLCSQSSNEEKNCPENICRRDIHVISVRKSLQSRYQVRDDNIKGPLNFIENLMIYSKSTAIIIVRNGLLTNRQNEFC